MTLFNYISALEIDFHKETLVAKFHVLAARRNLFPSNVQWAGMPHTCLGREVKLFHLYQEFRQHCIEITCMTFI
jgi:hypothetical protein